jgi:hypothetical protein
VCAVVGEWGSCVCSRSSLGFCLCSRRGVRGLSVL